jgi:hypothetical protein
MDSQCNELKNMYDEKLCLIEHQGLTLDFFFEVLNYCWLEWHLCFIDYDCLFVMLIFWDGGAWYFIIVSFFILGN